MKEREAQNPRAGLNSHWMKAVHEKAHKALDQRREAMKNYYNRKAIEQPDLKVGDQVMLKAKNIRTKRPSKKLSPKLYGPCKILEKRGNRAFKLEISRRWKIHPVFHVSLLEPYRTSVGDEREQPAREPEDIDGNLEWEVEKIIRSEIIAYTRKVRGRNKRMRELRYFVKWKGCSEDENPWEPLDSLDNAQELVDEFHRENDEMPGSADVE